MVDDAPGDAGRPPERRIYCNRTLNLRAIRAVGFDMDYTLIHYQVEQWERRVYEHCQQRLLEVGWPVGGLQFDPDIVALGLVLDLELGNVVKANRFGYVRRAGHGTRMLGFEEQRDIYSRELVDLSEKRWEFLNTLFALSEGCLYMQAVDLLDAGKLPGTIGYEDLYRVVRSSIDETHMEGTLKSEIVRDPDRYIVADPELPLALLDMKNAGKRLMVVTNSEWSYTREVMAHAIDPHLPAGMKWRDLFDVVIVGAGKPGFFNQRRALFEIVDPEAGLLRPARALSSGGLFFGGDANHVEAYLRMRREEILYVGDHIFADVHVSKSAQRWRTALVVRALEDELTAIERSRPAQQRLTELMESKEVLERASARARLELQRLERGYGPTVDAPVSPSAIKSRLHDLRSRMSELDSEIAPLAREASELVSPRWGMLLRAGNDKSHLARQIERYADIYTSRVSNFLDVTPFAYLRSPRGSLPHDS